MIPATEAERGAGRSHPASAAVVMGVPVFRYMIIDTDGQRVGRFESSDVGWKAGDRFDLDESCWRIVEILPEVSTMVTYNEVWVAEPASPAG
jgi:hypothetical protein